MKLASNKHFFLCFFYQSAFCLTHTHPQSNASNFVFASRPRIFSMQPGAARSQTTNLQGLNRCPLDLLSCESERMKVGLRSRSREAAAAFMHWLRDASSFPLISSGVCSLCEYAAVLLWWVAEAVMIKQAVIIMKNPLHPLHHLLDSLTGNFAAWHSARIACIYQWDKRLNLNSRTELKPFALLLNCSCQVQIVVQFQSDTKICWWL